MGLSSAFFRSYNYDYELKKDKLKVLSTAFTLLLLTTISITLAIFFTAPFLADVLFNSLSFTEPIRIVGLVVLLQNLTVPGFAWLRAENRAYIFSILSIVNLLIYLSATIAYMGLLHMQMIGSLLAMGTGYASVIICIVPLILVKAGVRLHLNMAKELLSFGLPNVSNFISIWVSQLADRYLLGLLGSLSQTASYSLAYTLGGILSTVILAPFTLAWPSAMFTIAKKDNAANVFGVVFHWYAMVLLLATFALSLFSTGLLDLLFPTPYHSAATIIPIIAVSIMFYGFITFL